MNLVITFLLPIVGILFSVLVLSQAKGSGLGAAFGGGGEFYASKRGAEKVLFQATYILGIVFLALAFFGSILYVAPTVFNNAIPSNGINIEGDGIVPIEINTDSEGGVTIETE